MPPRTPRRILHVITTLDRGGAEKALLALVRGFRARPAPPEVAVAFLKGRGELRADFEAQGATVHDLDVRGLRAARSQSRFSALARTFAPDVVHTHLFKADVLAAACLGGTRRTGPALVSTKHNVDVYLENRLWKALGRAAVRRADAVVGISDGVARFVAGAIGAPPGGIDVIRYGVEPDPRPIMAPPRTSTLLCVARFEPQKDHATLLDAVEMASAEHDVRLVLLGRGPLEAKLRERAGRIRDARIEFAGFDADPTPRVDAADAVVLASRWEGLGLALVEAALRRRPAIATTAGGIPEVVADGETGLLVPPGDARALADAILRVVCNPDLAERMGERAAERAAERFSVARCVAEHDALYARVLGSRS